MENRNYNIMTKIEQYIILVFLSFLNKQLLKILFIIIKWKIQ